MNCFQFTFHKNRYFISQQCSERQSFLHWANACNVSQARWTIVRYVVNNETTAYADSRTPVQWITISKCMVVDQTCMCPTAVHTHLFPSFLHILKITKPIMLRMWRLEFHATDISHSSAQACEWNATEFGESKYPAR
jgi:hypothetical protein